MVFPFLHFSKAQVQYGWCSKTYGDKTCQPNVIREDCAEGFSLQRPTDCHEIVCINPDGTCQYGVPYRTCIEENKGMPGTSQSEECIIGCCGVAGRFVGITTLAKCKEIVKASGFSVDPDLGYLNWFGGLEDERECALKFANLDRGCCVTSESCKFGYRKECLAGNFYKDTFCSAIRECGVKTRFRLGCGVMSADENNIYWFDSANNQEDINRTCTYPQYICDICNNDTCEDAEHKGINVKMLEPYCRKTECNLTALGIGPSQYYKPGKWGGDISWRKPGDGMPEVIPSGYSLCHNFYTGKAERKDTIDIVIDGMKVDTFPAR